MNKQQYIIVIALTLVFSIITTLFLRGSDVSISGIQGVVDGLNKIASVIQGVPTGEKHLGAIPGDEVLSDTWTVGGNKVFSKEVLMNATSSAICAIQNPFNATSSILRVGAKIVSGLLGDNYIDISTTTADFKYGSSTPALVYNHLIPSISQATIVWKPNATTTVNAVTGTATNLPFRGVVAGVTNSGASSYILGPTDYITWRLATTSNPGTFATGYRGTCTISLEKL